MTLRSSQTSSAAFDAVGILDNDGFPVISGLRPVSVDVVRSSKKFTHPLENNAIRSDHKIITPIQIEYRGIIQAEDFQETYNQIERLFIDSTLLTVQTRAGTYESMIIQAMPHKEDTDLYNAISIVVSFEETQITQVVTVDIDQAFSTVNRGQVQPGETSPDQENQGSILIRTARAIGGG